MKLGNVKDVVMLAVLGAAGYAVYKFVGGFKGATDKAGEKVATFVADTKDALSEFVFGPKWSMTYLIVNFSGGVKHAIPVKSQESPDGVDSKGFFTFRGKRFVIRDKTLADGTLQHWAFNP